MRRTLLLPLATMGLALGSTFPASADDGDHDPWPTLTVQGQADVPATPDLATVSLGATIQAPEAAAAQRQVNDILRKAIDAIRRTGVPDKDVQTAQITLHPVYSQQPAPRGGEEGFEPKIVAYRATNTIRIRVEDLSKVGAVIDAGMTSGANELQGVDFGLRDDQPQRISALRGATEEASRKARAIAEAAGVALLGVHSIQEGGSFVMKAQPEMRVAMMADAAGAPVQPGQVRVQASVTMTLYLDSKPPR